MRSNRWGILLLLVGLLAAPTAARATPHVRTDPPGVTGACDPIDTKSCLLPFPNDLFTVADKKSATRRRVHLNELSMPRNAAGVPVNPSEWNRNDGFSPSSPVLTFVPGLDLHQTWGSTVDHIADLARYTRADAPIVVLDATTGQRQPFWSELDSHRTATDADRLLILRPAVQFKEGHRYVVAMRRMRGANGAVIGAGSAFKAYRDRTTFKAGGREFEARRPHMERLLRELGDAGVGRSDLFIAWDFTVASERNLTERALHIRDTAFDSLGDTDLADGTIKGRAPAYSITRVEDFSSGATMRRVEGTVKVPNFLTPQVEVTTSLPEPVGDQGPTLVDAYKGLPPEVEDALEPLTDAVPIDVDDLLSSPLALPDSKFLTTSPGKDRLPIVNPAQPTVTVPFVCNIARGSDATPSHPMLYGHGLLGRRTEANGGSTERLRERGFSPCAVDWWGLSFSDLPQVGLSLADFSNFPGMVDRMQQGFLNFMFLGRVVSHPRGLVTNAAFRGPAGQPLIRTGELTYDGNSQGGIMGGALTALAPDLQQSVLGVPGMAYSTLLNRSVDWEGEYSLVFERTYPDQLQRQITYALIQMIWDRGEASGYAQHMTSDPLKGTRPHNVMLQVAFADHQVANVAAEVEGRTIGAKLKAPALSPGLHWSSDPSFGFATVTGDQADVGSVLVYWFAADTGLTTPPNGNLPPTAGSDPHGRPRSYNPATDQVARFLLTGDFIDVCGGGPCIIPKT